MVDNGNEPSKLSFPASYLVNQITLSLPGSGTEGRRDRRAPPQVQLVLSLEQLYNSVMENTEGFELQESNWESPFGPGILRTHCLAVQ